MRTVRSLFSVSGSSLLAWGLLVSVTSGCGKGDDGPKLNCPNGMRTIWLDALNNVGAVSYTHLDVYKRQNQLCADQRRARLT